ncbi:MAG TPA: hypothetical protein VIC59_04885 [Gemmatimonadota bacterium]|jgi:hypothetical protein
MSVARCLFLSVLLLAGFTRPTFPQEEQKACCEAVDFQAFDAEGVSIQLLEVKRTGPDDVTATWKYVNSSEAPQQLTKGGAGPAWAAYRLCWDAELRDDASGTGYPVARNEKTQAPMAAKHEPASASKGLWIGPGKTLKTWAKFPVPAEVSKVTVTLPGASQPWEDVAITP